MGVTMADYSRLLSNTSRRNFLTSQRLQVTEPNNLYVKSTHRCQERLTCRQNLQKRITNTRWKNTNAGTGRIQLTKRIREEVSRDQLFVFERLACLRWVSPFTGESASLARSFERYQLIKPCIALLPLLSI